MGRYNLTGPLYDIREDLKAFNCKCDPSTKEWTWVTPSLEKDSVTYRRIKSLVTACDGHMTPRDLIGQPKIIQDILTRRN